MNEEDKNLFEALKYVLTSPLKYEILFYTFKRIKFTPEINIIEALNEGIEEWDA